MARFRTAAAIVLELALVVPANAEEDDVVVLRVPVDKSMQPLVDKIMDPSTSFGQALFLAFAPTGDPYPQYMLGMMYMLWNGTEQDINEGARWLRMAADQEYAEAQFALGYLHATGTGFERDVEEAVTWYRMAAEQGYAAAQYRLGYAYEHGEGVPVHLEQARKWYRKAADQDDEEARERLEVLEP